jgi:hypothetical protein
MCVIGVCVWSSQYAPWLDAHGTVFLSWAIAGCCVLVIFIALVGAGTSMCMGDKMPKVGWMSSIGQWLHAHPWTSRIFIICQVGSVLLVTFGLFIFMIVAFVISDDAHKGLAEEVKELEDDATRMDKKASNNASMRTVLASHFALIGVSCLMLIFCLLSNAAYSFLYMLMIKNTSIGHYEDSNTLRGTGAHRGFNMNDDDDFGTHNRLHDDDDEEMNGEFDAVDNRASDIIETVRFDTDEVIEGSTAQRSE